jgi:ubiquitin C-terminal hydrolase
MQISKDKIREKSHLLLGSYAPSHSEDWKIDNTNISLIESDPFPLSDMRKGFSEGLSLPSDPIDQVEGCIGYPNIGNSCYMNAVLQILNAFPEGFPVKDTRADPFLEHLLKLRLYSKQGHPIDEEILRQLRKVTFAIKAPSELTEGINAQQDVHEFLLFVLNKMEWDSGLKLRFCRKGLHLEFQRDYEEIRKDILISINGESFQEILDKNFQFKMMSDLSNPLRCTVNGEERTFDRWNERLEIREHPSHLIIHLERFKYDSKTGIRTKVTQKIQFPKNHRVVIGGKEYAIVGFINHQGNTSVSGHYTADIRKEEGTWIRYDDLSTTESQFQNIDKNAYIVILKQEI